MAKNELGSLSPHYSWALLLQLWIRRCDRPGRELRTPRRADSPLGLGQQTVASLPPFLAAPRARLAWRLPNFATDSHE